MTTDSKAAKSLSDAAATQENPEGSPSPVLTEFVAADSTFEESAKCAATQSSDHTEICLAHQEKSWSLGVHCSVEEVVQLFPILHPTQESETLMALICNEVFLREESGECPTLVEYQERFPQLAELLKMQWEIDGLLTLTEPKPEQSLRVPQAGRLIGRYEIVSELGRGAMGVVYLAWDPQLKRKIALKRLRTGADSSAEEVLRIRTEAEAIAQIQHPAIVQIFDVGEVDELPYLAMEYCAGGTLSKRLDGKPILPRVAAKLIEQICGGVAAAHQRRIIHRDLKPKNILLEREGDWSPKVSDFGLAKLLDSDVTATATGNVLGTPAYMSPEQAFGDAKRVGTAADVYSLGAILYECLTGRPPFVGVTIADTLQQVRQREPISVRQLEPHVPLDLETITHKCMRKEPHQRYANVVELQDDLTRFLNRQPIRARRERWYETANRLARKHPLVSGLTTASAILMIAVTVVSLAFAKTMSDANIRIRKSEVVAKLGQANALVSGARGIRVTHEPGQRFEALKAIGQAAKIYNELNQAPDTYDSMRDEAILALSQPDAYIAQYRHDAKILQYSDFSNDHRLLALSFDSGPISIRQLDDHRELATLPRLDTTVMLSFLGNDHVLQLGEPSGKLGLWNVGGAQPKRIWHRPSVMKRFKMSPDRSLLVVENARTVEIIKTSSGSTLAEFSPKPYSHEPAFALHPTHSYLIICSYFEPGFEMRNWETGETIVRYNLPDDVEAKFSGAAWSNDGRRLALVTSNGSSLLWFRFDPDARELTLDRVQKPSPSQESGLCCSFNESGDGLLFWGWNNRLGLVDTNFGIPIFASSGSFKTNADMPRSDPHGKFAGLFRDSDNEHRFGMMSISRSRERTFLASEKDAGGTFAASDPSGRILAFALFDKISIVDVASKRPLLTKHWRGMNPYAFFFADKYLYLNSPEVVCRFPYKFTSEKPAILTLGIPERVHFPGGVSQFFGASQDGTTIAIGSRTPQYAGGWVKLANEPAARKLLDLELCGCSSVSKDGKRIALVGDSNSLIFSPNENRLEQVKTFSHLGKVGFSKDGGLMVSHRSLFRTDDWHSVLQESAGTLRDISQDGNQLAGYTSKNTTFMSYVKSGKVFARVEGGDPILLPDASKVVTRVGGRNTLYDLKLIRQGILDLGIPWTGPDYADCAEPEPVAEAKLVDELDSVETVKDLVRVMDKHCEERARLHPQDGQLTFSAAMLSIDRRNWPEALERIDRSCKLLPDSITSRQWRSYLLAEMRRWPEAIADADCVLEQITDTRFRLLRAEWLFRNRDFTRSIEECTAIIQNAQGFATLAHGLRSFSFVALGNNTQAIEDRDYFFKNTSDDPSELNDSAFYKVSSDISLRHPTLAKLFIEKLESLQPDFDPNIRDTIGLVYFRNDDYERAIDILSRNLADTTSELYAYALSVIIMCEAKLDKRDAAEKHMKDLVNWQPSAGMQYLEQLEMQHLKAEALQVLSNCD